MKLCIFNLEKANNDIKLKKEKAMEKEKSGVGKAIKGFAIGAIMGAVATMVFNNKNISQKIKKGAENIGESMSSMFKID